MTDAPTLFDLILAFATVALLFAVRAFLTLRRIDPSPNGFGATKFRRAAAAAFDAGAFGPESEPERRSAVRQIFAAIAFAGCALAVAGWSVAASVLGPFLARGFGGFGG